MSALGWIRWFLVAKMRGFRYNGVLWLGFVRGLVKRGAGGVFGVLRPIIGLKALKFGLFFEKKRNAGPMRVLFLIVADICLTA